MRNIAAYLLAVLGGKTSPTVEDIKAILGSVGIECDEERVKDVIEKMKGRTVAEVMGAGRAKLSSVGGVASSAVGSSSAAAEVVEEKKEEVKEEEEEEESDDDMGLGLFD